ncbi:hypothetical protein BH11BAC3_BH11BAC3_43260 [soil metagenome]
MKKFKTIDLTINVALIIGSVIFGLINRGESFIGGYFVVGIWQVISMVIHAWNKWFTGKRGQRYMYHWITLISVATLPLGSFWILLFTAPFMAIYYTWLCYHEVYVRMQRPLALLK